MLPGRITQAAKRGCGFAGRGHGIDEVRSQVAPTSPSFGSGVSAQKPARHFANEVRPVTSVPATVLFAGSKWRCEELVSAEAGPPTQNSPAVQVVHPSLARVVATFDPVYDLTAMSPPMPKSHEEPAQCQHMSCACSNECSRAWCFSGEVRPPSAVSVRADRAKKIC